MNPKSKTSSVNPRIWIFAALVASTVVSGIIFKMSSSLDPDLPTGNSVTKNPGLPSTPLQKETAASIESDLHLPGHSKPVGEQTVRDKNNWTLENLNTLKKPTAEQLALFLQENRGSAEALLAASQLTGNMALLRQAAEAFPNNPQVQLELATRGETPEERRQALDAFRKSDPNNAIGDYLSALDNFQQGKTDAALQDLVASSSHTSLSDHTDRMLQSTEEAYISAGYSPAEAKSSTILNANAQQLMKLNDVSKLIVDLQTQYSQQNDTNSAHALREIGIELAQKLQTQSKFMIGEALGYSIEKKLLNELDASTPYGNDGKTVGDRLADIKSRRDEIARTIDGWEIIAATMSEKDAIAFFDRMKLHGEQEAIRWLKQKHGK